MYVAIERNYIYEVEELIEKEDITEFSDLIYRLGRKNPELHDVVVNNSHFFTALISSRRHVKSQKEKKAGDANG